MSNPLGNQPEPLKKRYKEHIMAQSPIFEHNNVTGYTTSVENSRFTGREGHDMPDPSKKTIYIKVNNPNLNRNIGKYNLPHIWDKVLFSIPKLKTK